MKENCQGKKSLIKKGILAEITKIMNTLKQTLKRKIFNVNLY